MRTTHWSDEVFEGDLAAQRREILSELGEACQEIDALTQQRNRLLREQKENLRDLAEHNHDRRKAEAHRSFNAIQAVLLFGAVVTGSRDLGVYIEQDVQPFVHRAMALGDTARKLYFGAK